MRTNRPRRRVRTPATRLRAVAVRIAVPIALVALLELGPTILPGAPHVIAGSGVEAWLDRPTQFRAAGTRVGLGFVLWDPEGETLVGGSFPFVAIRPATGDAQASQATATEDWRGHYVADLLVPEGGTGEILIGVSGTACDADGCHDADALFPIAGTGPPPGIPLTAIAGAQIAPPPDRLRAGQAARFAIELRPNADWDPADFPAPDELFLQVSAGRGTFPQGTAAARTDRQALVYGAAVTFPGSGSYQLRVTTGIDPGRDGTFPTSLTTVTVEGPPSPEDAPEAEGVAPLVVVGGILALGLVVIVIVGGFFAGRRQERS